MSIPIHQLTAALLTVLALAAIAAPVAQASPGDAALLAQAQAQPRASGKNGTSSSSGSGGSSAEKAGQELGKIVFAWAGAIVFALAAMMITVAIGRRNVGELVTVMLISGVGSLFVLNNASGAKALFQSIINQIT